MELRNYVSIIRKWLWLILLGAILGAGTAYVFGLLTTPVYQSTITLLVSEGRDPSSETYMGLLTSQRLATTYVEQIKSSVITGQVINDLNLALRPEQLASRMTIQNIRDTQLIRISVEDPNPERAQAIATQIAKVFTNFIYDTQQARYQSAQKDIDDQVAAVRKRIDDTQKALVPLGDPNDTRSKSAPDYVRTEQVRLQMELSTLQAQYTVLLASAQQFRLAVSRSTDTITISSPADLPQRPIRPNLQLNTGIGLVVGILLGVGIAFLIEYLDDTLKSPEDVTRVLNAATLGAMTRFPGVKTPRDSLITIESPRAPYAEAYRNLRTNLQFSLAQEPSPTVVISSAGPREGKSTTTANLGVVFAQMGKKVILVDTDLRRPSLHEFFNLPPEPGLSDLILDPMRTVDSVLQETQVPGLGILTSGKIPPNPAEILASEWMERLINTLRQKADIVLLDTPPILPVTDAVLLAAKTGKLLLVIDAAHTRADAAVRARSALTHVEAKLLGVVLNRAASGKAYGDYYHYYYSKDGNHHGGNGTGNKAKIGLTLKRNGNGSVSDDQPQSQVLPGGPEGLHK